MDQNTGSALPSKGEVAFRFIACTGIALALYYTPELKWNAAAAGADPAEVVTTLRTPTPMAASCAPSDGRGLLIDAALKAN